LPAPAVGNKTNIVNETAVVVVAGVANDAQHKEQEEKEEEIPVRQWWGWIFLIPLLLMATLGCFAVFMFKVNAGMWSKHKRSQLYSRVGSGNVVDAGMMSSNSLLFQSPSHVLPEKQLVGNSATADINQGMISSASLSPQSPVRMCLENQLTHNSPTPGPSHSIPVCPVSTHPDLCQSVPVLPSPSPPVLTSPGLSWLASRPTPSATPTFPQSPVHPQSSNILVPMVSSANAQLRHLPPVPMSQTGVVVTAPPSPRQLPQQQLQQQQQRQGGQQQMLLASSQQQMQVQSQKSPPSQQAGNSGLFVALDQNQDGAIIRDEFNRACGVSPLLAGSGSTTLVSPDMASGPSASMGTPSMVLASSGGQSNAAEVVSPLLHPNPPRVLAQITSTVQAVVAESWCH